MLTSPCPRKGDSKKPRITASLLGQDLLVVTGKEADKNSKSPAVSLTTPAAPNVEKGLQVSLIRVEAELTERNPGQYQVTVPGALIKAGNAEVTVKAQIPLPDSSTEKSVARQPLQLEVSTNPIDLKQLLDYLQGKTAAPTAPVTVASAVATPNKKANKAKAKAGKEVNPADAETDIGGTLTANIAFGGSLDTPALSGTVSIADAHLRLPKNGDKDRISPITKFDASLRLAGGSVLFDQFQATLGGLNGKGGDYGTFNISGGIALKSLAELEKFLRQDTATSPARRFQLDTSLGEYNLALAFKNFRPEINNLFGLGEAAKGRIEGVVQVRGDLLKPSIITPVDGAPIKITEAEIRPPTVTKEQTPKKEDGAFQPSLDMLISLPEKTVLVSSSYRFEAKGYRDFTVKGNPLASTTSSNPLSFTAELVTIGGFFQLPTTRFKVARGGRINVRYGGITSGIVLTDVSASSKVSLRRGVSLGTTAGRDALTSNSDPTTPVSRYDITLTLNGPVSIFEDNTAPQGVNGRDQSLQIKFTSDPYLPQEQILSLVGAQNALQAAQQGQLEGAAKGLVEQALRSSYFPGLVSQLTGGVAETLGLDDLTVDYNFDDQLRLRVLKRLPDPFERFIVDYSRTFQQRATPNQLAPYTFSFSYELYQFSANYKIQPRLSLGFQTNEQRNYTYFLRGTVSY